MISSYGSREIAIFAKAFLGTPSPTISKKYATTNAFGGPPVVLLHSLHIQQRVCNILSQWLDAISESLHFHYAKKRFVKTHASLLEATRLLSCTGLQCVYFHYKSSLKIVRMPELGPANHVVRLVRFCNVKNLTMCCCTASSPPALILRSIGSIESTHSWSAWMNCISASSGK